MVQTNLKNLKIIWSLSRYITLKNFKKSDFEQLYYWIKRGVRMLSESSCICNIYGLLWLSYACTTMSALPANLAAKVAYKSRSPKSCNYQCLCMCVRACVCMCVCVCACHIWINTHGCNIITIRTYLWATGKRCVIWYGCLGIIFVWKLKTDGKNKIFLKTTTTETTNSALNVILTQTHSFLHCNYNSQKVN